MSTAPKGRAEPKKAKDIRVFISTRDAKCDECGEDLGTKAWITLVEDRGARCLSCADLDHLAYLPAGDAALTRRARKHADLSAVVLKWSRARKRYERQGLLVSEEALERAERECLDDADARAARRAREAERRAELDEAYVRRFAARVRELFPSCPTGREEVIAEHACRKYSGRVGRTAQAKALDADVVRLAVVAHVRHAETMYDAILARGGERRDAREQVRAMVDDVLARWRR